MFLFFFTFSFSPSHFFLLYCHRIVVVDLLLAYKVLTPSSGFALDFAVSIRPDYHKAIIDTIRYYGWKKIIYLYDSHDGE